MRFTLRGLFAGLLFLPGLLLAHEKGESFEEIINGYLIDIGYSELVFITKTPIRFDFRLLDNEKRPVSFDSVWVQVERPDNLMFAGRLEVSDMQTSSFLTSFSDPGTYTLTARYARDDVTLVEYKKQFSVSANRTGIKTFAYDYRWVLLTIIVIGVAAYFRSLWVPNFRSREEHIKTTSKTDSQSTQSQSVYKTLQDVIDEK